MANCPNISNSQVRSDFNQLIEILGGRPMTIEDFKDVKLRDKRKGIDKLSMDTVYYLWDIHNGNMSDIQKDNMFQELIDYAEYEKGYNEKNIDIKDDVKELFESNPELANSVYEALGLTGDVIQDNKSYYRGQIEQPTIDKDGNLVLYAKEDELYKKAGLKSKGVSMTDNLKTAIDYGNGQLEVAQNLASESYDAEQELDRLLENGYYLIQIPKNISNEVVKEAGEVKVIGDKIIIPKGQYKIEQVTEGLETQITPEQKQQAQQKFQEYVNATGKQDIDGFKDFAQGKQFQKLTAEEKAKTIEQVTKEHRSITALKDLSAKLAHRIGGKVQFENNPNADWKGYNQGMTSVLNEAYMTPDTPFHEILAHPIIRAIKARPNYYKIGETAEFHGYGEPYRVTIEKIYEDTLETDVIDEKGNKQKVDLFELNKTQNTLLYQNLLKELETGRGKEVFEQVKRDYTFKKDVPYMSTIDKDVTLYYNKNTKTGYIHDNNNPSERKTFNSEQEVRDYLSLNDKYTLEEQQEEAIVTLLGMMAADKLDAKKDATLISKLKELWKQISDFVKSLLKQDGIKIDELPITTTLNDLAEIMAYGDNKIILPGYKVEYSTPLGNKYDTLEEVNNEIRGLADANVEVDLSGVKIEDTEFKIPENINSFYVVGIEYLKENGKWFISFEGEREDLKEVSLKDATSAYKQSYLETHGERIDRNTLKDFIEKNKEYEQVKEIIEQWKKENNIQYDPEEVYSRGQGFYSSIGAYSNLELDLLLKNLIQHIEDNKKAGGEFTISAFTRPINKRLKHIEGTGDRIRFVIYPKSEHIKWAAPTDVYSGSVWDASEKVSKDKKSELLGVSFTKAPALGNINEVSPNLADIIDNLSHVHNELGIELTTNNFRIEYDDNIDYSTKKLIDNINKILDDKYGKLEKPEINKIQVGEQYSVFDTYEQKNIKSFATEKEAIYYLNNELPYDEYRYVVSSKQKIYGKQPTQTKDNTTSIESVKDKIDDGTFGIKSLTARLKYEQNKIKILQANIDTNVNVEESKKAIEETKKEISRLEGLIKNPPQKEYTSQAEINLKVAALKEVARKYPRSLITSKVVPINPNLVDNSEIQYSKVGSKQDIEGFRKFVKNKSNLQEQTTSEEHSPIPDNIIEAINKNYESKQSKEFNEMSNNLDPDELNSCTFG